MSGICGIVHWGGAPVDREDVARMARAAAYRAVDGCEVVATQNVGFAHLAHGLTAHARSGRQPLADSGDLLLLTADVRLDNRDELRRLLAPARNAGPPEPGDADLLLLAYRRWGTDCLRHLLGDFAFAVYDRKQHRLFAARDAMAMRPFYYRAEPERTLFASEVKQILAAPGVPARIFDPAVAAHLAGEFGRLDWTFYEGIAQLPPAHALIVDRSGARTTRYWEIDPDRRLVYRRRDEYVEHFRELFVGAVAARIGSGEGVGVFLSGGMDSGCIASTAAWLARGPGPVVAPIRAYSFAFEETPECDERAISDRLVRHCTLPVTYVPVESAGVFDYVEHGPDRDEPFVGVYQKPIEDTLRAARTQGLGLMLSGARGDLMVGPWVRDYLPLVRAGRLRDLWEEVMGHRRWGGASLPGIVSRYVLRPGWMALRRRLRRRTGDSANGGSGPPWIRPDFAERAGVADHRATTEADAAIGGYSRAARYRAVFEPLQMRGMVWSDRTYARYGIDFADPWSDRRIATFVLAAPQHVIAHPGCVPKQLAREVMRGIMPDEIRRDSTKIVPYPLYRRALEVTGTVTVESLLSASQVAARGYVDERVLTDHYASIRGGGRDHPAFWAALTLEMWLRRYWS